MSVAESLSGRTDQLRVGLLINPVAGLGGAVALKGSDGLDIQQQARARNGAPRGFARAVRFLLATVATPLPDSAAQLRWFTWGTTMGADAFAQIAVEGISLTPQTLGNPGSISSATDTRSAAAAMERVGVDLLVFVGGDGTARDLFDQLGDRVLVLGVPAGVKMHSGVFATTPEAAATVVRGLAAGDIVSACHGEVRDLNESQRRAGELRTRTYGEMRIPQAGGFVQHTKEGGRENESLALEEVVAHVVEQARGQIVLGPGSSCARLKEALGMQATLLGVDVWEQGHQTGTDVDARWLAQHAAAPDRVIVSFIRRQGFLFGRGNQQFSAQWLAQLRAGVITIVSTRSKLAALGGRPLLVDTDDPQLNTDLCGLQRLLVGYEDELWYRVATHS